jgi:hypothetical protein
MHGSEETGVTLRRRDLLRLTAAGAAVPLLSSCVRKRKVGELVALEDIGKDAAPTLTIGDAESELLAGTSRYAFGLTDQNGPVIAEKAIVFVGRDASKPPEQTTLGYQIKDEIADRGLYVATVKFPEAGEYLVAILATLTGGAQAKGGTRVTVRTTSESPAPGQPMPRRGTQSRPGASGEDQGSFCLVRLQEVEARERVQGRLALCADQRSRAVARRAHDPEGERRRVQPGIAEQARHEGRIAYAGCG